MGERMEASTPEQGWKPLIAKMADGLTIHSRDYPAPRTTRLPVICLAGLSRNSSDFHRLALALSQHAEHPRRVLAIDSRGRGRSDRDPTGRSYDVAVELGDCLRVLEAAGISKAAFVGTSRGGILTMVMASVRPDLIAGAVLNDIGPVLDVAGLKRIQGYVGKLPTPRNYEEAVGLLKRLSQGGFSGLGEADWLAYAKTSFDETEDGLKAPYDPLIALTVKDIDFSLPIPTLWPQFEALAPVPVLSIRGENSDLFSVETQMEMARRHPNLSIFTVPGQAHPPLLMDTPSIGRVLDFIDGIDPPDS